MPVASRGCLCVLGCEAWVHFNEEGLVDKYDKMKMTIHHCG